MNKQEIEPHIVQSFGHAYQTSRERVEDIAKRHHVHRKTIYKYAKLHGWVRPTHVYAGNGIQARIIPFGDLYRAYYEEVLSMKEIAKRYGCHERVVKRSMDHHELKQMPKSERIQMKRHFEQVKGGR